MFDPIASDDLTLNVCNDGKSDRANPAFLYGRVPPGHVGVLGVDGYSDDLHAEVPEPFNSVVVGNDLGRADKRKIKWPEKKGRYTGL